MIIRTELLQESCSKLLSAVDSNVLSSITDTLEISAEKDLFVMSVTNREYFVRISIETPVEKQFYATVNASLFLKLVSKVTSETIELIIEDRSLLVRCNGDYRIPLIYDGEELMHLPRIEIQEVSEKTTIDSSILRSIVNYNSKELGKGMISKPIQKLYYVDKEGAVTFTTGACVNKFDIPLTSKLLLNDKLVKLFKLFGDTKVDVTVGHNPVGNGAFVTVVEFDAPLLSITSALSCDDSMAIKFPVEAIRSRANSSYPYTISLNRDLFVMAIERLMLFSSSDNTSEFSTTIQLQFSSDSVRVTDRNNVNYEEIPYTSKSDNITEYTALINSSDLTKTLLSSTNQFITIEFGNSQAFVLSEGLIRWVIPECNEM